MPREMARTWRFDFDVQMPSFSSMEDVRDNVIEILETANTNMPINELGQSSFSYDMPQDDAYAKISGYLHVTRNGKLTEASVRTWIIDDRIRGEIKWTPIMPGTDVDNTVDWRKDKNIDDISRSCSGGTRRLYDWKLGNTNKGGRPKKTPSQADGGEGGTASAAPKQLGRPRKPPPVDTDTPQQAAVRDRLIRLDAVNVQRLCSTLFPGDRSWTGKTKYQQVDMLMKHHDFDRLARTLEVATTVTGAGADDCARRAREALRKAVSSANIQELRYICNHIKLDYHLCVDKSDYPGLFQGKVDAEYITEAVRIIRACGTTWITTRPVT